MKKGIRQTFFEQAETNRFNVLVYEKLKGEKKIKNVPGKIQGVWEESYNVHTSPVALWVFPNSNVPEGLNEVEEINGAWGFKPGVEPANLEDCDPDDMWFFPPDTKLPRYFTQQGVWTFPLVKRDVSMVAPNATALLDVGDYVKNEKLDVGGKWKLLYKAGDEEKGPGMKSRQSKIPNDMEIIVRTTDGKDIKLKVKPSDKIYDIKDRVNTEEGIPIDEQRLLFGGQELDNPFTLSDYNIKNGDRLDLDPMCIYVKHWKLDTLTLTVKPRDTIDDVKKQISKLMKIPKDKQRLFFGSKQLDDNLPTLKDCNIRHKSILELKPMQIHVRTPQDKKITLDVNPDDTIKNIKKKVQKKEGIPVDEQRLLFGDDELENGPTLDDYRIPHGATLDLEGMQIYIRHWNGDKFELDVNPKNTIDSIKGLIEDRKGIPRRHQRLAFGGKPLEDDSKSLKDCNIKHKSILDLEPMVVKVNCPDGKQIQLTVDPNDTIDDVKNQIQKKEKISKEEQRLTFGGKKLGDGTTLDENRIKHGSVLDLGGMQIFVREPDGKKYTLSVQPTENIDDVKSKLQSQEGIPKDQQRLSFEGKPLSDGNKSLKNYKIKHQSTLDLEPFIINVKTLDGKTIPFEVKLTDRIRNVKKQVEDKTGIPPEDQRLTHDGKELDDRKTIDSYSIPYGGTLNMEPFEIYVREPDGRKYTLIVQPSENIDDIKSKLQRQEGIPKDQQRLSFEGIPLKDDRKTLKDYKIKHQSTLDLDPFIINVKTLDGKTIPFKVKPTDKIRDVKKQVEDKTGIPPEDQRLTHDGKELDDRKTIDDYAIPNGSTLNMEPFEIYVREPDGRKYTLIVQPSENIDDIKSKLQRQEGIPKDQQRLSFEGKHLKDDRKTLKDYKIKHQTTLDLDPFIINVKTLDGKTIPFKVKPTDKIRDVKKQVEDKTGIPPEDQLLTYDGMELDDGKTIDDYSIPYGGTLVMEPVEKPFQIKVVTPRGNTTFDVSPTTTIDEVKTMVHDKFGLKPEEQKVLFGGKTLDPPSTLEDSNVKHMDTLKVLLNLKPAPKKEPEVTRKSYLPANWKEERDRFGEVTETFFEHDYEGEGTTFTQTKTDEKRYSINMNVKRKSERAPD